MRGKTVDEEQGVKSLVAYLLVDKHSRWDVSFPEGIDEPEVEIIVEHVEVFNRIGIRHVSTRRGRHLVEDGERVAHGSVGFKGDDPKGVAVGLYSLHSRYVFEMVDNVVDRDSLEIINRIG